MRDILNLSGNTLDHKSQSDLTEEIMDLRARYLFVSDKVIELKKELSDAYSVSNRNAPIGINDRFLSLFESMIRYAEADYATALVTGCYFPGQKKLQEERIFDAKELLKNLRSLLANGEAK